MTGLRERQKADREQRILAAAVRKFRADGYQRVRIEDLADAAEVSVGTVYNYYGSKGDILIATVAMEVEEVLAEGQAIVDDPPDHPCEAILKLTFCYYDHSLHYLTKEMWRTAMALAIEAPGTPNGRRYGDLDRRLAAQVSDLVVRFQRCGRIRPDIDAAAIGEVLFNNLNQVFIDFVKDEAMTLDALRERATALTLPIAQLLPAPRET
jgi:AcrR family transcriptional regulator